MFNSIFEIEYDDFANYEAAEKSNVDFDKMFAVYNALHDAGLADTKEAQHVANILQI